MNRCRGSRKEKIVGSYIFKAALGAGQKSSAAIDVILHLEQAAVGPISKNPPG